MFQIIFKKIFFFYVLKIHVMLYGEDGNFKLYHVSTKERGRPKILKNPIRTLIPD